MQTSVTTSDKEKRKFTPLQAKREKAWAQLSGPVGRKRALAELAGPSFSEPLDASAFDVSTTWSQRPPFQPQFEIQARFKSLSLNQTWISIKHGTFPSCYNFGKSNWTFRNRIKSDKSNWGPVKLPLNVTTWLGPNRIHSFLGFAILQTAHWLLLLMTFSLFAHHAPDSVWPQMTSFVSNWLLYQMYLPLKVSQGTI